MSYFKACALAVSAALLAACGAGEPAAEDSAGAEDIAPVVVYSSRAEQLIEPIFSAFTAATGVPVRYITDDPQPLIERLKAEGETTPASVLLTVDAGNLWFAAEAGVLQPLESQTLIDAVPDYLADPGHRWFGLSLRARTIVYDNRVLSEDALTGYADLADPKWRGKLCLRTSKKVYNQSLVAMLIAQYGEPRTEEIVRGWVENLATDVFANDTQLIEAIADGRCQVGIVNTYYLGRLQREADLPVAVFWQPASEGGVHVNVSGAGIVTHAKNVAGAQQLLEWLVGPEGQQLFASRNLEYPVVSDIDNDPVVAAWGTFDVSEQPLVNAGRLQADAVRLMDRAGYR